MRIALCGLPFSGKSTVFKAIVGKEVKPQGAASGKVQLSIGNIDVPDARLDKLAALVSSEKITYSKINLVDVALVGESASKGMDVTHIRDFDALVLVLGTFSSENALDDLINIEAELVLSDMHILQTRIERIEKENKGKPKTQESPEFSLIKRVEKSLEDNSIGKMQLTKEELKIVSGFRLFALKPKMVVANIAEEQLQNKSYTELEKQVTAKGLKFLPICARLEAEITEFPEEERSAYFKEMGLEGSIKDKFIQSCFEIQDLISFFTLGPTDAHAWPIRRNLTAVSAAGCIHSDLERGFIRAEVISYDDFITAESFAKAKENGTLRLESKEYIVKDADILNIKFSV